MFIFRTTRQYKQEEITEIVSENEFLQGRHRKNREIIHQKIQERLKSRDVQVFRIFYSNKFTCMRRVTSTTSITYVCFNPCWQIWTTGKLVQFFLNGYSMNYHG